MAQKIFSEEGALHTFASDEPKMWELRTNDGNVHFKGTASELDAHIKQMFAEGKYTNRGKRGRHKKAA